ncbi:hypothetical protein RI367_003305 [Sorochytrium milnesiophthora]
MGAFWAASRATWDPSRFGHNVWRSVASNGAFFGAMGGLFSASSCAFHQYTHTERYWGNVFGGFVTGLAIGMRARSFGAMAGMSTALAAVNLAMGLSENSVRGHVAQLSPDERNKWNTNMFWRNPEYAPVHRALDVLEKAGVSASTATAATTSSNKTSSADSL